MHRFFVEPHQIDTDSGTVMFTNEQAHQLVKVLRMSTGDQVIAVDSEKLHDVTVVLESPTPRQAIGRIVERLLITTEPTIQVTLYPCLLKRDNFEWVLQKVTEIGVSAVVPVESTRTVVNRKTLKYERWQRIVTEAAEQSGRGKIPDLLPLRSLDQALEHASQLHDVVYFAWEAETEPPIPLIGNPQQIAIFIGPEGGFTPEEADLARHHNAQIVTLGKRILRAETAAIYATSIVFHHLD